MSQVQFGERDWSRSNQIDFWARAIAELNPGFRVEYIRDATGGYLMAKIHNAPFQIAIQGTPKAIIEVNTFDEFYSLVKGFATYYQIGRPWVKFAGPAPWFVGDARKFWERASSGNLKEGEWGRYVMPFGPSMEISYKDESGNTVTKHTQAQLIWISAKKYVGKSPKTEIDLYAFHYIPVDMYDLEVFERKALQECNKDMYIYIERELIRPDIARQKLAGVNRELHQALVKFFFSRASVGGVVNVTGKAAQAATIIEYGAGKAHDLYPWVHDWYSAEH